MEGRWTIRWQPYEAGVPGGYKIGGTAPWPGDDGPTPVVPCDDAAVERATTAARQAIMESFDVMPPGTEPFPGWSFVLAERAVAAALKGAAGEVARCRT
jgi:hypothetical protein